MLYSKRDLLSELNYVNSTLDHIPSDIIKERTRNIVIWYIKGSYYQRGHYFAVTVIAALCNAVIPIIALLNQPDVIDILVASLSAFSGFLLTLSAHYRWHSNWLNNRKNAELIKSMLVQYLSKCEPYRGENADMLFLSEIERMVVMEGNNWFASRTKDAKHQI